VRQIADGFMLLYQPGHQNISEMDTLFVGCLYNLHKIHYANVNAFEYTKRGKY